MIEFEDYTFQELLNSPLLDEYKAFGLKSKGRDNGWCKSSALEWPWGDVKQIQDIINQPSLSYDDMIEIICIASRKTREQIMTETWHLVFKFYNFVVEQIEFINEREKQLQYDPDVKEVNAGIEEFAQFGWMGTLYRLAAGDPLKYDPICQLPYHDIFITLLIQKQDIEFQKKLISQNNARSG